MELKICNVSKKFDSDFAVNNVELTMNKGVYGLLGVNGAGKTTLMRMICTLLKPTFGKILYDNKNIFNNSSYRKVLGYLPQDFGYYPEFSVYDYLMYISSIKGIDKVVAKKRTKELIRLVGLSKQEKQKMKKLSGGMKRRAGIAQALLNNPEVLVLDEPTSGLDPNERIRFRKLISEIAQDKIVLLSTHIVSDVEYIASNIFLMKDGKILQNGSLETIINSIPEKVWNVKINKSEISYYEKRYKIVNMRNLLDKVEIRILSKDIPVNNAILETTTLEDVFLYYFGEKGGDSNDIL